MNGSKRIVMHNKAFPPMSEYNFNDGINANERSQVLRVNGRNLAGICIYSKLLTTKRSRCDNINELYRNMVASLKRPCTSSPSPTKVSSNREINSLEALQISSQRQYCPPSARADAV